MRTSRTSRAILTLHTHTWTRHNPWSRPDTRVARVQKANTYYCGRPECHRVDDPDVIVRGDTARSRAQHVNIAHVQDMTADLAHNPNRLKNIA